MSLHEHNEQARAPELVERIAAGGKVALVSDAGMPLVSDPGARLVAAVLDAGLELDVLPGASAVTTAIAVSGLSGGGFVFAGFLPRWRRRARPPSALRHGRATGGGVRVAAAAAGHAAGAGDVTPSAGPPSAVSSPSCIRRSPAGRCRSWPSSFAARPAGRSRWCCGRRRAGGTGAAGCAFRAGRDDRGAAGGGAGRTPYRRAAQPALSHAHREMTPPASSILQAAHTWLPVVFGQAGARAAKHAHVVRSREGDGVPPHADFERVVDIDPQSSPDLDGDHDPAQFIDPSYDATAAVR